jgi:SAM-dependent methyltransferase
MTAAALKRRLSASGYPGGMLAFTPMTKPQPYTADFFKSHTDLSYAAAQHIVPLMLDYLPARSVLDVGCGTGQFLRVFGEAGISDLMGIDGSHVPVDQLSIELESFRPVDLTRGFDLGRKFDLVMSVEVAEHMPANAADLFIDSLTRHGSAIVFSAAIPHQGGTGHVNEQWPSYWARRFDRRGFKTYDLFRPLIWQDDKIAWWYRQNLLLFAAAEACARYPKLAALAPSPAAALDRVHPDLYLLRVQAQGKRRSPLHRLRASLRKRFSRNK